MTFLVMWDVKGYPGGDLRGGQTIEADLADVPHWVAVAFGGAVPNPLKAALSPLNDPLASEIRDPSTYEGPLRDEYGFSNEAIQRTLAWNACPIPARTLEFT